MADFNPGSTPWRAVPSIWPKAEACIVDAHDIAIAHVIDAKHAPVLALAPELLGFVEKVAGCDPVFAKGAEKERISIARQLRDRVLESSR